MKRALAYVALLLGAFAQSGTAYAHSSRGYYQGIGNGMKK
jgi:hypothetical protein